MGIGIDEEELASAILGTVIGLSAMAAAGAQGTLGEVEVTEPVTVAIYCLREAQSAATTSPVSVACHSILCRSRHR